MRVARAALGTVAAIAALALFTCARPSHAQGVAAPAAPAAPAPPLRVITLDEAIRIALDQNATVRLARNGATLDSLSVRLLRNQFLPNLSASVQSSQAFGSGSGGSNATGTGGANPLSTSLGISSGVTLYNGRQNVNALGEARLVSRASTLEFERTRQTIVFVVASDFLALITQQQLLRVQLENLVGQQEQLTQLEAFTAAGTRNIGDLYQQQSATAATRLAVETASRGASLAEVDLIEYLVLDPRASYEFSASLAGDSLSGRAFDLDSLIATALRQRADLRAQALRVEAAAREVLVAEGSRLPVVSATAGYGSATTTASDASFASQLDQRRGGSVGVGVAIPLFDRGAAAVATQRAKLQLDNETLALRDQVLAASLDVRRAYLNYQSAQEQLAASDAQQKAAALALEAAQTRYRVGLATFVELTLARATLVQAQSAVVTARSSLAFLHALMAYYTGALDPAAHVAIAAPASVR